MTRVGDDKLTFFTDLICGYLINIVIYYFILVGEAIPVSKNENPTHDEIEELQKTYITALRKLYDDNKERYGKNPERQLIIN